MTNKEDLLALADAFAEHVEALREAAASMPLSMAPPSALVPMQPVYLDPIGTARFRGNALVRYLLDRGGLTLNDLARLPNIPREDWAQLAQLIGYSVSGYGDLSYALGVEEADAAVKKLLEK